MWRIFWPFAIEKYFLELSNHLLLSGKLLWGGIKECQQLARKPFHGDDDHDDDGDDGHDDGDDYDDTIIRKTFNAA